MENVTYIKKVSALGYEYIERINEDGSISLIPEDPTNSDYQAYLNPEAEQSTLTIEVTQ